MLLGAPNYIYLINLFKKYLSVIKKLLVISILIAVILAILSCSKLGPGVPASDQTLDGPLDGLTYAQLAQHARGDAAFTDQVFTVETGLGPLFVANSCGSCHGSI